MRILICLFMLVISAEIIAQPLPYIGRNKVHIFGDSHSICSFRGIVGCQHHPLGPLTMHRVGRDGLAGLNVLHFGVREGDMAIFVVGEIDARCHVGKQCALGRHLEEVIATLVDKYLAVVVKNRELFKTLHCVVFAVIPPTDQYSAPEYPLHGSLQERVSYTQMLNHELHKKAALLGISVLDVYDDYKTPQGSLALELSDGGVHIGENHTEPVRKKLYELLRACYQSSQASGYPLQKNIPQYNSKATHNISFEMPRSISDGALKTELLQMLQRAFKIDAFVESGTYLGATTNKAADVFKEVHTVELSQELFNKAQERFKGRNTIFLHQGNSGIIFSTLLPKISSRVLFYLDGHYSGGITAQGPLNTPVLDELYAIRDAKKSDAVIMIDDIWLFQNSLYPEKIRGTCKEGYPTLSQVVNILLQINNDYQICFLGDALLAFPKEASVTVSSVVSGCAFHRFAAEFLGFSESILHDADCKIRNAQGKEREELITYFQWFANVEMNAGFRSFSAVWYALVLASEGKQQEALIVLQKAANNSMPHWRAPQILKEFSP